MNYIFYFVDLFLMNKIYFLFLTILNIIIGIISFFLFYNLISSKCFICLSLEIIKRSI